MKGLIIWAYSECRSMMGLYRMIKKHANFPVVIASYHHHTFKGYFSVRTTTGFTTEEFSDIEVIPIGENLERGLQLLDDHPGYYHLFAFYQGAPNFIRLMKEIKKRGEKFGCICESPCNMQNGWKGFLKEKFYYKFILPRKVKFVVENAECFFNLSGDSSVMARKIGWPGHKILPWGYYSPPIPDSHLVKRTDNSDFTILVSGAMTWHRAPEVALSAMRLLTYWGVKYRAVFTQGGPMLEKLKRLAKEWDLPVEFVGLVPMPKLIELYESCSVYVASGRNEPWGMRLNDALQCGAPIVVSRGMGGVKLVDDYGCGGAFCNEDYVGLAHILKRLAEDKNFYTMVSHKAFNTAKLISPEAKAVELLDLLERIFSN